MFWKICNSSLADVLERSIKEIVYFILYTYKVFKIKFLTPELTENFKCRVIFEVILICTRSIKKLFRD